MGEDMIVFNWKSKILLTGAQLQQDFPGLKIKLRASRVAPEPPTEWDYEIEGPPDQIQAFKEKYLKLGTERNG